MGITALVLIAIGTAIYRSIEAVYFASGVILTTALNILKLALIERTVKKAIDIESPDAGKNYVRFQSLLRYFLTGIVLLAAGLISVYVDPPFINIWGAIIGIFTLQISLIVVRTMKVEDGE